MADIHIDKDPNSNPLWITIVIVTAALMVLFLLFFGPHTAKLDIIEVPKENSSPESKDIVPEQPGPSAGVNQSAPAK